MSNSRLLRSLVCIVMLFSMITTTMFLAYAEDMPMIEKESNTLAVDIGESYGNPGDIVVVPIDLKDVPSSKILGCDFRVAYDREALEVVGIEPGAIVINPEKNFGVNYSKPGVIYFLFSDATGSGSESISKDGNFANIEFKIKENAAAGVIEIGLADVPTFCDLEIQQLPVTMLEGGINVIGKEEPLIETIVVEIAEFGAKPGDIVDVPVNFSSIPSKGINNCDFSLSYNPDILEIIDVVPGPIVNNPLVNFLYNVNASLKKITFLFCDETGLGEEMIPSGGGCFAVLKVKINQIVPEGKSEIKLVDSPTFSGFDLEKYVVKANNGGIIVVQEEPLMVRIESVKGKPGEVIEVPISIDNVPLRGIVNFDFRLSFDEKLMEVTELMPGPIVPNPEVSFLSNIINEEGKVIFCYCEETGTEKDAIKENGILAKLKVKIKEDAPAGKLEIKQSESYVFGDYNLDPIPVIFNNSVVIILPEEEPTPVATPVPVPEFGVKVGIVEGKPGKTVEVPVYFINVPQSGIDHCNFTLEYDKEALEIIACRAGSITKNPVRNFYSNVTSKGEIVLFYCDETGKGKESIRKDGEFAKITLRIKNTAKAGTSAIKKAGADEAFGDYDVNLIPVKYDAGGVIVTKEELPVKGRIEAPVDKTVSGHVTVSGYVLDPDGVSKLEVLVDGKVVGYAKYGIARHDIYNRYKQYGIKNSGFNYELDTTKLSEGKHVIKICVISEKGVKTELQSQIIHVKKVHKLKR